MLPVFDMTSCLCKFLKCKQSNDAMGFMVVTSRHCQHLEAARQASSDLGARGLLSGSDVRYRGAGFSMSWSCIAAAGKGPTAVNLILFFILQYFAYNLIQFDPCISLPLWICSLQPPLISKQLIPPAGSPRCWHGHWGAHYAMGARHCVPLEGRRSAMDQPTTDLVEWYVQCIETKHANHDGSAFWCHV